MVIMVNCALEPVDVVDAACTSPKVPPPFGPGDSSTSLSASPLDGVFRAINLEFVFVFEFIVATTGFGTLLPCCQPHHSPPIKPSAPTGIESINHCRVRMTGAAAGGAGGNGARFLAGAGANITGAPLGGEERGEVFMVGKPENCLKNLPGDELATMREEF